MCGGFDCIHFKIPLWLLYWQTDSKLDFPPGPQADLPRGQLPPHLLQGQGELRQEWFTNRGNVLFEKNISLKIFSIFSSISSSITCSLSKTFSLNGWSWERRSVTWPWKARLSFRKFINLVKRFRAIIWQVFVRIFPLETTHWNLVSSKRKVFNCPQYAEPEKLFSSTQFSNQGPYIKLKKSKVIRISKPNL